VLIGTPTPVQGYVIGGIGIDHYNFRGTQGEFGYSNDTSGSVPVGLGVRAHAEHFTADARVGYDALFSDDFSPVNNNIVEGRWTGLVQVGGTF